MTVPTGAKPRVTTAEAIEPLQALVQAVMRRHGITKTELEEEIFEGTDGRIWQALYRRNRPRLLFDVARRLVERLDAQS